ncbi:ABC transporter ATP-binding protein [Paenibacillus baekrokdamisoli]|uniref:ABC transporter ATP-binding protein n=1 Tax=Paenibacillus baekrokdamisoli TaxID=1712516 RepID=A0A3G9ITI6_9BACL|nr:ATP-binding cassette domain-containing protein [Paenibacillus baekrokdamisoli]MBB3070875.1 ABC-2 type transport system ATP-binding protein [Paenibacillus baekrokdamisoli]BBH22187.1 ABC transporter ATP-binding protein [Paenibacillus baekrokdamisoli]
MIAVSHLSKQFKTPVTKEGRFKGIRTLLSRDYRIKEAVSDISFSIEPGEFVGYIGPNGAGKSTTIKMLSGILHPSSGEVQIAGMNPHRERRQVARRLGVLFGQRTQLWWDLPVCDSFDILAAMYGLSSEAKANQLNQLVDLLDLSPFMDTPVRKLSLGQRMRADIVAALLHNPDILFLDEPTIGLDLIAKRNIREFLRSINLELGKTILLTTHDMDDIEQLCGRVIVINDGRLGFDGTIDGLRRRIGLPTLIRVTYRNAIMLHDLQTEDSSLKIISHEDRSLTVACNREQLTAMDALKRLEQLGEIEDVHMDEPDFEDVVHRVY